MPLGRLLFWQLPRAAEVRWRIILASFLLDMATGMHMVGVPLRAIELNASAVYLGGMGSALAFGYVASALVFGALSDRVRRTDLIRVAPIFYSAAVAVVGVWHSLGALLAWAFILPVSNGMFWPAWQGWITDVSPPEKRRGHLSLFCVSWSSGLAAGTLAGGVLAGLGMNWVFVTAALMGVLTVVVVWPERGGKVPANEHELRSLLPPVTPDRRWMLLAWMANFGTMFSVGSVRALFPKLTVSLGIPSWQLGALLMLINGTQMTVFYLLGRSTRWQGNFRLLVAMQAALVLGLAMLGMVEHPLLLAVPMLAAGAAAGLNFTLSMSYSVAGEQARGLKAGLHEAVAALGGMSGPVLSGVVVGYFGADVVYKFGGLVLKQFGLHAAYPFCGAVVLVMLLAQQVAWWRWRASAR